MTNTIHPNVWEGYTEVRPNEDGDITIDISETPEHARGPRNITTLFLSRTQALELRDQLQNVFTD